MASDSEGTDDDLPSGRSSDSDDEARVLLFMRSGRDRELVAEAIGDRFRVEVTTDAAALESTFDCCVFGTGEFDRVAGAIEPRRERAAPAFLPFVLLAGDDASPAAAGRVGPRRRRRRTPGESGRSAPGSGTSSSGDTPPSGSRLANGNSPTRSTTSDSKSAR